MTQSAANSFFLCPSAVAVAACNALMPLFSFGSLLLRFSNNRVICSFAVAGDQAVSLQMASQEEIDNHVLKYYEIGQRVGKGVSVVCGVLGHVLVCAVCVVCVCCVLNVSIIVCLGVWYRVEGCGSQNTRNRRAQEDFRCFSGVFVCLLLCFVGFLLCVSCCVVLLFIVCLNRTRQMHNAHSE